MEDFTVEEENGAKSLVLGGGGNMALGCQVHEEGLDFRSAHVVRVAFDIRRAQSRILEEDIAAHPIEVGFFGAKGVVPQVDATR